MSSSTYAHSQTSQRSSSPQYYEASDSPIDITSYARSMHQHTKKQMEAATKSSRRRSPDVNGINAHATLDNHASMSSLDSRRST
ncbi:hypothetical protein D0Z07_7649 [Hyphodiscus hymeniophilus]|uniref:Uncharacterized protein n=1 Tax=Hyphodiscus hymeniophilus TaxID=353542 RepID=A0A9P7AU37_9HELO|nr:hypothetical protein D0Z07_7649 [Hyphodiscus hymeniophilus]